MSLIISENQMLLECIHELNPTYYKTIIGIAGYVNIRALLTYLGHPCTIKRQYIYSGTWP